MIPAFSTGKADIAVNIPGVHAFDVFRIEVEVASGSGFVVQIDSRDVFNEAIVESRSMTCPCSLSVHRPHCRR